MSSAFSWRSVPRKMGFRKTSSTLLTCYMEGVFELVGIRRRLWSYCYSSFESLSFESHETVLCSRWLRLRKPSVGTRTDHWQCLSLTSSIAEMGIDQVGWMSLCVKLCHKEQNWAQSYELSSNLAKSSRLTWDLTLKVWRLGLRKTLFLLFPDNFHRNQKAMH